MPHQKNSEKNTWNLIADEWARFREEPRKEVVDFLKNKKGNILDLGCGSGRHFIKSKDSDNKERVFYGIDFSEEMLRIAEKKIKDKKINAVLFKADLSDSIFEKDFFDSAIFVASLHCLKTKSKRKKAVKELYRILKPGAEALISVWNKDSGRFKTSKKEKYVKWRNKGKRYYYFFDEKEIYELFQKENFRIIKKYPQGRNIVFVVKK